MPPPKLLAHVIILCFEKDFPKKIVLSAQNQTICPLKSETANDGLAEQNASQGLKEVSNWTNRNVHKRYRRKSDELDKLYCTKLCDLFTNKYGNYVRAACAS